MANLLHCYFGTRNSEVIWKILGTNLTCMIPVGVANKIIDGKQHTVRYHADNLMGSHVNPKVNDKFLKWLDELYGHFGEVKARHGPVHNYLGMTFDFSEKGIVKLIWLIMFKGCLMISLTNLDPKMCPQHQLLRICLLLEPAQN